jgi:hypothetical protein
VDDRLMILLERIDQRLGDIRQLLAILVARERPGTAKTPHRHLGEDGEEQYFRFRVEDQGWLRIKTTADYQPVSIVFEAEDGSVELLSEAEAYARFPELPLWR